MAALVLALARVAELEQRLDAVLVISFELQIRLRREDLVVQVLEGSLQLLDFQLVGAVHLVAEHLHFQFGQADAELRVGQIRLVLRLLIVVTRFSKKHQLASLLGFQNLLVHSFLYGRWIQLDDQLAFFDQGAIGHDPDDRRAVEAVSAIVIDFAEHGNVGLALQVASLDDRHVQVALAGRLQHHRRAVPLLGIPSLPGRRDDSREHHGQQPGPEASAAGSWN